MKPLYLLLYTLIMLSSDLHANETVVLLHGLIRSPASINKMGKALEAEGYKVVNIGYPSREHRIETLAAQVRAEIVRHTGADATIHFVTHSMGGILVRQIQKADPLPNIGRVVMISPPQSGQRGGRPTGRHQSISMDQWTRRLTTRHRGGRPCRRPWSSHL